MNKILSKFAIIGVVSIMPLTSISGLINSNSMMEQNNDTLIEEYQNSELDSVDQLDEMDDKTFQEQVKKTAELFEVLMLNEVIFVNEHGFVVDVDIDKLEAMYGVNEYTLELRSMQIQENGKVTRDVGKHLWNFGTCMVGKMGKDLAINELKNILTGDILQLLSKGKYQQFVQKLAQKAVNKLGKKAASKLVSFIAPAGWVVNAFKMGKWAVECTVFYD